MKSVNEAILVGNVGNDPEIRTTQGGARIAKLSLATGRTWTDKGGQKQEKTDWHRLAVFGKLVDVVEQWVHKGDRLYIRGRIEYSTAESDQGTKYFTDIVVSDLVMLGGNKEHAASPSTTSDEPGSGLPF